MRSMDVYNSFHATLAPSTLPISSTPSLVYRSMYTRCTGVDRSIAFDNFSILVHSDEVGYTHAGKGPALGVEPKGIGLDGIAGGAVA